ncbi:transposase, partial [Kitasatospora sp. NPDC058243]|uniref:transposase n=1 Tax=Kitasatospora sp. NPDC058243 TaxID=3346397 RepID=UPI0036D86CA7
GRLRVVAGGRRKYGTEFRAGAVRIVVETGKPVAEVARDLGVSEGTLGSWVVRARKAGGDGTLEESERDELRRLRQKNAELLKDNAQLVMERDVLKRCMVLWVK